MTPGAEFIMPVPESAAAMQMLIDQVRRLSDAVDRFTVTMSSVQQQLARMEAESQHVVGRVAKNETRIAELDGRLDTLENRAQRQDGATGVVGWFLRSPAVGWIVGAGMAVWALLGGHR